MHLRNQITQPALILLLIASALLLSFSSLLAPYALRAWPAVLAGGGLGLFLSWRQRYGERVHERIPAILALLSLLAAGFTQVLAANGLPSGLLPLHSLPARDLIYLLIGMIAAFGLCRLYLMDAAWAPGGAALAAGGLYTSVVFFRVGAVPEIGYAFSVLAGFALLALLAAREYPIWISKSETVYWLWTAAFLLALVAAIIVSPVPGQSLAYVLGITVTISLAAIASVWLRNAGRWQPAAWVILVLGAGLPALLALIKTAGVLVDFGPAAALAYRLHPSEMGGANLIARSLLVTAPLGAALFFRTQPGGRRGRWLNGGLLGLQVLILAVILYARSFEGFFAWLVTWILFAVLSGWDHIRGYWQRVTTKPALRMGYLVVGAILALAVLYTGARLGYDINPYSFSGRFQHWAGAIEAWQHHPLLGGGPDNEYLYTQHAGDLTVVGEAQQFIDDPLYVVRYRFGLLMVHAHNLLLETAAFSGLAGLLTLSGLLAALMWIGLKAWKQAGTELRLLAAACLAGIAGELAWGLLDVIRESPPFFSFPVWALIGLLLAIHARSQPAEVPRRRIDLSGPCTTRLALAAGLLLVLLPAAYANRYGSGFLAFQEHRWADAANGFRAAALINPLSAQAQWMRSKAELEMEQWSQAAASLQEAIDLKQGFSPYLAQAGWLAWMQGDLQAAEGYFEQAAASDPLESWTPGLHANLGLLRAYQGRPQEALAYFAKTLEHHPELAAAPYWVSARLEDGRGTVALAADYDSRDETGGLQRRIFAHLGMANIGVQHFNPAAGEAPGVTLESVLDTLHESYLEAAGRGDPTAHLILAAEAEAARQAGLYERAEAAYREYQVLRPESAFGYRDLALVNTAQHRLEDAQTWLEKAVQVSPRNIVNLRLLADVRLARGEVEGAGQALDQASALAAGNAFQLRFFDVDLMNSLVEFYRASGHVDQELEVLERLARTRGTPDDTLALAGAFRAQQREDQALAACWQAYDRLVQSWVRPYDSRLWTTAECLAASDQPLAQIERRAAGEDFTQALFLGHIARLRGQTDAAEAYYRQAITLREDETAPLYYLGEFLLAQGRPEEAAGALDMAAELDEFESLPLFSLGQLYTSRGDLQAASQAYQVAVARVPGSVDARLALANYYLRSGKASQAAQHLAAAGQLEAGVVASTDIDLVAGLAGASLSDTVTQGFVEGSLCTLNGPRSLSIFMHPDSWAGYDLRLPDLDDGEKLWLTFQVGLMHESWEQPGDGVKFSVSLKGERGEQELFSTYLDPKNDPTQRGWQPAALDVSAFAGQQVTLTLRTDGGPAGDLQFDWACWGSPRITVQAAVSQDSGVITQGDGAYINSP